MTTFENKCSILGDIWLNYRQDTAFTEFFWYNDLGLPLAFAISEGIVDATPTATQLIEESFAMLLGTFGIPEDIGYVDVEEILADAVEEETE